MVPLSAMSRVAKKPSKQNYSSNQKNRPYPVEKNISAVKSDYSVEDKRFSYRNFISRKLSSKISLGLALTSLLLVVIGYFLRYRSWHFDDSAIVYRIVENIVSGFGFFFNSGEAHNASTSVLNPILIAIVYYLTHISVPDTAHIVGALSLFASSLGTYLLFRSTSMPLFSTIVGIFVLVTGAESSTWGLESMLFLALLIWASILAERRRPSWLLHSLLVLTRPDGIIFVALVWLKAFWNNRKLSLTKCLSLTGIVTFLLVLTPWIIYSLTTFGEIFPATLSNKRWQARSGFWGSGNVYLSALISHLKSGHPLSQLGVPSTLITLSATLGLFALIARSKELTAQALWLLVIFVGIQQVGYALLNVPGYHWYFYTLDCTIVLLAAWFFATAVKLFTIPPALPVAFFSQIVLLAFCGTWLVRCAKLPPLIDQRDQSYTSVAKKIQTLSPPPISGAVAAVEVGSLSYQLLNRPIVDMIGLTSANPQYLTEQYIDNFFRDPPALILLHDPLWPHELTVANDPRFHYLYEHREVAGNPPFRLTIYSLKADLKGEVLNRETLRAGLISALPAFSRVENGDKLTENKNIACIIDRINGYPPTVEVIRSQLRPFILDGWALDPSLNFLSSARWILLSENEERFELQATRTARPDVAKHFQNPNYELAGLVNASTLIDIPLGSYRLGIAINEAKEPLTKDINNTSVTSRGIKASVCWLPYTIKVIN